MARRSPGPARRSERERRLVALCFALLPLERAAFLRGLLVEPRWPEVTFTEVETPRLSQGKRFRVVHLTDFHAEERSLVLDSLPERVNALRPDLLVFTGDTLNSAEGLVVVKDVLAHRSAGSWCRAIRTRPTGRRPISSAASRSS
ncbi:MAG: hypothetical protein ACOX6T_04930 [Myxococcales bacterium]|jgi:hypothetical protein